MGPGLRREAEEEWPARHLALISINPINRANR
jgi:hypothetical protein